MTPCSRVGNRMSTLKPKQWSEECRWNQHISAEPTSVPRAPVVLPGLDTKWRVWKTDAPVLLNQANKPGLSCKVDEFSDVGIFIGVIKFSGLQPTCPFKNIKALVNEIISFIVQQLRVPSANTNSSRTQWHSIMACDWKTYLVKIGGGGC